MFMKRNELMRRMTTIGYRRTVLEKMATKRGLDQEWLNDLMLTTTEILYEVLTHKDNFQELMTALVRNCSSFRFCGGAYTDLAKGKDFGEVNDLDIFYVPKDGCDEKLLEELDTLHLRLVVSRDVNVRSKGCIHDIKVGEPGTHVLDFVSRKEVAECEWVDSPSCKTGLCWTEDGVLRGEQYHIDLMVSGVLVIKESMSDARVIKLKGKGWVLARLV